MSILYGITLVLAFLGRARAQEVGGFPRFVDTADRAGLTLINLSGGPAKDYILEAQGSGAGFFDYDGDGDMDVLIANGSTLSGYEQGGDLMVALYRNDGGKFTDVSKPAGLGRRGWGMGVCAADYDNDGDQDFYVTAWGSNVMYRNNGDGTFMDVTKAAGTGDARWSTNCAFGDYDRDGYVDLYVANYLTFNREAVPKRGETGGCSYMGVNAFCGPTGLPGEPDTLYRNNGDGTFRDVTKEAGITDPGYYGYGVVFSDLDDDGWPDIYVANDTVPNLLFKNNHDGTFSEVGLVSGTAFNGQAFPQAGMGVTVGDYDGDGRFDIFVTNFILDSNTLYRNMDNLFFYDVTNAAGLAPASLAHLGWGVGFEDLDNDGWLDLFVANGHVVPQIDNGQDVGQRFLEPKEVYRNLGNGKFEEITKAAGADLSITKSTRGVAFGDYDNDGDIDALAINMDDRPSLYRNDGGNRSHWISFRLVGTRSNRDAIGARIEITAGGRTQVREVRSGGSFLSHNDIRAHFGLGKEARVESVRIRWPKGNIEELGSIEANRFVTVREGAGIVEP